MFDALNKYGLPAKYAILIGAASVIAVFILNLKDPGAMTLGGYAYTGLLGVIFGAARDVEYWGAWAWATLRLSGHPGSWQLAARYREAYLAHRPDARAELERTAPFHRTAALLRIAHGWSALRADPDTMASVIAVAGVVSALL